jgi:DNA-directed RNA polymerase specialized sigma24 family protein
VAAWKTATISLDGNALVMDEGGDRSFIRVPGRAPVLKLRAVRAVWSRPISLPATVVYVDGRPVRVVVPLSDDEAYTLASWMAGDGTVAATTGQVRIAQGRLVVPRPLYAALRSSTGNVVVSRYRETVTVRPGKRGLAPLDLGSEVAIDAPATAGIPGGDYPAVVVRSRGNKNPRLIVRIGQEHSSPPDPDRLHEVVQWAVWQVRLYPHDREELVQELFARAWQRGRAEVKWAHGQVLDAVNRRSMLLARVRAREADSLDAMEESARARLEASRPWPSPSVVELRDLLERELLPAERRFVALLASGYTPEEAANAVGVTEGDALLARVRAIVARALDEAGQPPLRPSERWARGPGQFPALPAAVE